MKTYQIKETTKNKGGLLQKNWQIDKAYQVYENGEAGRIVDTYTEALREVKRLADQEIYRTNYAE